MHVILALLLSQQPPRSRRRYQKGPWNYEIKARSHLQPLPQKAKAHRYVIYLILAILSKKTNLCRSASNPGLSLVWSFCEQVSFPIFENRGAGLEMEAVEALWPEHQFYLTVHYHATGLALQQTWQGREICFRAGWKCYREASGLPDESEAGGVSCWISSCRKLDSYEDHSPWLARFGKGVPKSERVYFVLRICWPAKAFPLL